MRITICISSLLQRCRNPPRKGSGSRSFHNANSTEIISTCSKASLESICYSLVFCSNKSSNQLQYNGKCNHTCTSIAYSHCIKHYSKLLIYQLGYSHKREMCNTQLGIRVFGFALLKEHHVNLQHSLGNNGIHFKNPQQKLNLYKKNLFYILVSS